MEKKYELHVHPPFPGCALACASPVHLSCWPEAVVGKNPSPGDASVAVGAARPSHDCGVWSSCSPQRGGHGPRCPAQNVSAQKAEG